MDRLPIGRGSLVSIIGAGGKTTVMLALAQDLAERGLKVLVTTTTRIWPPALPLIYSPNASASSLRAAFEGQRVVALGGSPGPEGKVRGVAPDLLSSLAGTVCDVVICEADGAAGRPLKVHGPGEPVVPGASTDVLIVAGLDAVGSPASPDVVHRFQPYLLLTGATGGDAITPSHVASVLIAASDHVPNRAGTTFVLNKADDTISTDAGKQTARLLPVGARCVLTRRARPVDVQP